MDYDLTDEEINQGAINYTAQEVLDGENEDIVFWNQAHFRNGAKWYRDKIHPSIHFQNPKLQERFERVDKRAKNLAGWKDIEMAWNESTQVNPTNDYVFRWLAENYNIPNKK